MKRNIDMLENKIAPLKKALSHHKAYQALNNSDNIRTFMEYHVYAVWDFMTLLKSLQRRLTCVELPWRESSYPTEVVRFINEIVIGEESDLDQDGNPVSHYSLYIDAMMEVGADVSKIQQFVATLDFDLIPEGAREFVQYNLELAEKGTDEEVAAAFLYGREKLIPEMFTGIKNVLIAENADCPTLIYYLERHIELDGDEHGPLAEKCLQAVCGEDQDKWSRALAVAEKCLQMRDHLWNTVNTKLEHKAATKAA